MAAARVEGILDALGRVVRAQRSELARLARREGLGAEDALDCAHDAFCTYLQLALRGELPADAAGHEALLAGIAVNAARNKRRRHYLARPHQPIDAEPSDGGASPEALLVS